MMKITNIKQQVKNAERFSVFIDNKYSFSLNAAEIVELGIRVGQDLEEKDLDKIGIESELSLAKNQSLRFLSYRARSKWEIEDYLKKKDHSTEVIKQTVDYLTSKVFIDDEEFARLWVETRLRLKQTSLKHLRYELRLKKVPNDIIESTLAEQDIDEIDLILKIIEKKRSQIKFQDDLKMMQYLARHGYSYDKIKQALDRSSE